MNVSVLVDDQHPIKCATRLISDPVIKLHSYKLKDDTTAIESDPGLEESIIVCDSLECFNQIDNAEACSLLKAVVVVLNVLKLAER